MLKWIDEPSADKTTKDEPTNGKTTKDEPSTEKTSKDEPCTENTIKQTFKDTLLIYVKTPRNKF